MSETEIVKYEYEPLPPRYAIAGEGMLAQAKKLQQTGGITDEDRFIIAGTWMRECRDHDKAVEKAAEKMKKTANMLHKMIVAEEKRGMAATGECWTLLDGMRRQYLRAQEQARRQEQARIETELRRIDADLRAKEAEVLRRIGDEESAAAVEAAPPPMIVAPPLPPAVPKEEGFSYREVWTAKVIDMKALLRAVLDGSVPELAITVNQSYLDKEARNNKSALRIAGVRAVMDEATVLTTSRKS